MARRLLTAVRSGPPFDEAFAEPVLVEMDDEHVTLTLDDGDELTFILAQLRDALGAEEQDRRGMAA